MHHSIVLCCSVVGVDWNRCRLGNQEGYRVIFGLVEYRGAGVCQIGTLMPCIEAVA